MKMRVHNISTRIRLILQDAYAGGGNEPSILFS